MRTPRTALLLLVAALFATGTALADGVQTTAPDACAVFTARLMKVNIQVYERNDEYSGGGEPWSVNERIAVYGRLAAGAAIDNLDPRWFAVKYKTPAIGKQTYLFILGDHRR